VPFVQQLFGKQHRRPYDPRFLIACACSFGNRARATEGGIPMSPHRGIGSTQKVGTGSRRVTGNKGTKTEPSRMKLRRSR